MSLSVEAGQVNHLFDTILPEESQKQSREMNELEAIPIQIATGVQGQSQEHGNSPKTVQSLESCLVHSSKKAKYIDLSPNSNQLIFYCSECAVEQAQNGKKLIKLTQSVEFLALKNKMESSQEAQILKREFVKLLERIDSAIPVLQAHYSNQIEKVNFDFMLLEKILIDERNDLIAYLNKSLYQAVSALETKKDQVQSELSELERDHEEFLNQEALLCQAVQQESGNSSEQNEFLGKFRRSLSENWVQEFHCVRLKEDNEVLSALRSLVLNYILVKEEHLTIENITEEKLGSGDTDLFSKILNAENYSNSFKCQEECMEAVFTMDIPKSQKKERLQVLTEEKSTFSTFLPSNRNSSNFSTCIQDENKAKGEFNSKWSSEKLNKEQREKLKSRFGMTTLEETREFSQCERAEANFRDDSNEGMEFQSDKKEIREESSLPQTKKISSIKKQMNKLHINTGSLNRGVLEENNSSGIISPEETNKTSRHKESKQTGNGKHNESTGSVSIRVQNNNCSTSLRASHFGNGNGAPLYHFRNQKQSAQPNKPSGQLLNSTKNQSAHKDGSNIYISLLTPQANIAKESKGAPSHYSIEVQANKGTNKPQGPTHQASVQLMNTSELIGTASAQPPFASKNQGNKTSRELSVNSKSKGAMNESNKHRGTKNMGNFSSGVALLPSQQEQSNQKKGEGSKRVMSPGTKALSSFQNPKKPGKMLTSRDKTRGDETV